MYRQLNDKEEQVVHQYYSTEELEKYIQKQPHNTNVEINELHEDGQFTINLQDIESNSCDYVYCD